MKLGFLPACAILLMIVEVALSYDITRRSPPDRNVFSRYANSRFPFFTVDLSHLQDKQRSGGGKRALGTVQDKDVEEATEGSPTSQDIAAALDIISAKHLDNVDVLSEEILGYEDAPLASEHTIQQSAVEKRSELRKRIHTCAFMRRMGVPIGLCFSNLRRLKEDQKTNGHVPKAVSGRRNPYDYLERQWQGHTMLGGGVGRR